MRRWIDLFEEIQEEWEDVPTETLNHLKIQVSESYQKGITLKRDYQKHLKLQQDLEKITFQKEQEKEKFSLEENESLFSEKENTFTKPTVAPLTSTVLAYDPMEGKKEFYQLLPTLETPFDFSLCYQLLFYLAKERKDYLNLVSTFEEEEKEFIYDEIRKIDLKIAWIQELYHQKPELEEEEEVALNSFVFLMTNNGRARVLADLKSNDIPEEAYPSFKRLFRSIQEGSFQHLRKLDTPLSIYEVKDGQSRIIFSRIYQDYYCILTAYVKKCSWEKELQLLINQVVSNYQNQMKDIYALLFSEDKSYLEEQTDVNLQVFQLLGGEVKEGGKIKCLKY